MKFITKLFLVGLCCLAFSGCGAPSAGVTASDGSTISFNIASLDVTDTGAAATWHNADPIVITVRDKNGAPVDNAQIKISYPWALPNGTVVQLYDGFTAMPSPMTVKTGRDGTYTLYLSYQSGGGLDYFGDLGVISGTAYAKITITIKKA